jgi:hypothetical protein
MTTRRKRVREDPEITFVPIEQRTPALQPHPELAALHESGRYQEVIDRRTAFLDRLRSLDALVLLGISGFYSQVWSHQASVERKPNYELEIADLEFLQSLLVSNRDAPKGATPTPDDLPGIWAEVRLQYFSEIAGQPLDQLGPDRAQLADRIRLHSAYYRNPYGLAFCSRMLQSVAGLMDASTPTGGVRRFSSFVDVLLRIVATINDRTASAREQIRSLFDPNSDLPNLAKKLASESSEAQELFDERFGADLTREEIGNLCYNMIERSSWLLFRFTTAEIRALNHNPGYNAVDDLKLCAAEFSQSKTFGLTDPWYRPFIHSGDSFYLFSPYTPLSFPFHLLLSLGNTSSPEFKSKLERIRGKFLETEAKNLFAKYLPRSTVISSAYWKGEGDERIETDLLVIIEDRLVIVEAKGAILPDKLRTGHYLRTRTFLRDTFGSGNLQAVRLMRRLAECSTLPIYDERGNLLLSLQKSDFAEIIPIIVTVEQLGIIANVRSLLEVADIPDAAIFEAMPIMVSELDYLLSLLPDQSRRLHYLSRRSRIYREQAVLGDELDLFALYSIFGFSAEVFKRGVLIWALGASYSLKNYINCDGALDLPESSGTRLTPYFSLVLSRLDELRLPGYLNASFTILDTPPTIQESFERALMKMKAETISGRQKKAQCNFSVETGIASHVLIGTIYRGIGDTAKNRDQNDTLRHAMAEAGVRDGLLLDIRSDKSRLPFWSFLSFLSS